MVKRVLCYGDSNTFGLAPLPTPTDWRRYDSLARWPRLMGALLGDEFEVIEEGLPGRTTVLDDPIDGAQMNGLTYLLPCLASHWPLDAVVVMLGTNDLKKRFAIPAIDIATGAGMLLTAIKRAVPDWTRAPKLMLVAPAPIRCIGWLGDVFAGGEEASRTLGNLYAAQAAAIGAGFFDAGTAAEVSDVDGIHFGIEAHRAIGEGIAAALRRQLEK